jgi:hypothetical protein
MNRSLLCGSILVGFALAAACGTSSPSSATGGDAGNGTNNDGGDPGNGLGDSGNGNSNPSPSGDGGTNPGNGDDGGNVSGQDGGTPHEGGTAGDGGVCDHCPTGFACETGGTLCKSNGVPAFGNVYLIVEENHSYATVKGATYIASLIANNASASNYMDSLVHPSLPNYLTLTSGSNQGVVCDCQAGSGGGGTCPGSCTAVESAVCNCVQPTTVANIADRIEAKGLTWHAYGEDMTAPGCDLTNHGEYVARHIPFVYYDAIQTSPTRCANVVPWTASSFGDDLGKYSYSFIAPDLGDDGHTEYNGIDEVTATDNWLKANVPAIIDSASFKTNGALFITWDEGDSLATSTDDHVLLMIISPFATKTVTAAAYSHTSLLDTIEEGLGLQKPHLTSSTPIDDVWKN